MASTSTSVLGSHKDGNSNVLEPILTEKMRLFTCFSCGRLGHEKIQCGDRCSTNPKESSLVKRRFSMVSKGFAPESRLHIYDCYPENQLQTNTHEDVQEDHAVHMVDPVHPMQVDFFSYNEENTSSTREPWATKICSASNNVKVNCLVSLGPSTEQPTPLIQYTCRIFTLSTPNLISVPITYTAKSFSPLFTISPPNHADNCTQTHHLSSANLCTKTCPTSIDTESTIPSLSLNTISVTEINPSTLKTSSPRPSFTELIITTTNHSHTKETQNPAMVFKAQTNQQMSNSPMSGNITRQSTQVKRQKIGYTKESNEDKGDFINKERNEPRIDNERSATTSTSTESLNHDEPNRKRRKVDDQSPEFQEAINILLHQPMNQKGWQSKQV